MGKTDKNQKAIFVFGAAGGIGINVVKQALEAGYFVKAVVRHPEKLSLVHPSLKIIKGDIRDPSTYDKKINGIDAIISAIGGSMTQPTDLYSEGNLALIKAMEKTTVNRVYFISASAIEISPFLPWYIRLAEKYIIQKLLKHGYDDQRRMEKLIGESNLEWTIIRPPRLTDSKMTGQYRLGIDEFLRNCLRISRADVAHFILNNIYNKDVWQTTVEIGY